MSIAVGILIVLNKFNDGLDPNKLYELFCNEEQSLLKAYHDRVRFYIGLITAILAGTIAGLMRAEEWFDFIVLVIGPIIIIAVSRIAHEDTERAYAGWLSAVTRRAKIEDEIGLTSPRQRKGSYWGQEPIIPERYVLARKKVNSSVEFEKNRLNRGHHKWARRLLAVFAIVGIIGLIAVVAISYTVANNPNKSMQLITESPAD